MPAPFSLSRYSRFVANALTREPALMGAWVAAEISDLSSSGGHCYMTLIEKDPSGATIARMRATIWASRYAVLRRKFAAATGRELANGMKVMLFGGANYHSSYGLSFNVGDIDPSYTMGDLERIRREILAALQRERVLELNKQLPVNFPPQRIAIISSEKAAGYGDFVNQLQGNASGAVFYSLLFPAVMQGDRTAASVMQALDMVEQTDSLMHWDCVAIIRGGGATTDMNGFDNLELARRVATFPIPIAVGIGHERDRCVLDEIAAIRCKTPTAVAAWLSDSAAIAWARASELTRNIAAYAAERLKGEHIRLRSIQTMLPATAESQIKSARMRLHNLSARLPAIAADSTSKANARLQSISATLRLASAARLEREEMRLKNISTLIDVLSPAATLKRGYTITRVAGKAIYSPQGVAKGEIIETITSDGSLFSSVV